MRTEDARHVLTTGLDRLAATGARRVKVCFEPGNAAARNLSLSAGFRSGRRTVVLHRP